MESHRLGVNEGYAIAGIFLNTIYYLAWSCCCFLAATQLAICTQTVMHFHCHVIPRCSGDMEKPDGGIRHCVEGEGHYGLCDFGIKEKEIAWATSPLIPAERRINRTVFLPVIMKSSPSVLLDMSIQTQMSASG
ncbi:MAG: hypothetical protein GY903_14265 [Fuerstiella sp.]|nr:hypothetical protein [Fuerstiella sp.]MCP4855651.1 hypothetical protein [Fuerstiella sp.]